MYKIFVFSILLCVSIGNLLCNSTEDSQPILEEGLYLYRLERASWYGTDLFLSKYNNYHYLGGYFSYTDSSNTKCVFFSNSLVPEVIGLVEFDSTFNSKTAKINLESRKLTNFESDLFLMRERALKEAKTDTLVKTYNNTNLNFIPIIKNNKKYLYIITGTSSSEYIYLGNDYLFQFDDNNEIVSKKKIHSDLIPIKYTVESDKKLKGNESFHNHFKETGDFITATDICTLLLYKEFTKWKTHNVISEKYLNIFDLEKKTIFVMPIEDLKKIYGKEGESN